ncbi:MAG TPA: hypothetical protein VEW47_10070 [Candidatus Dormibacteraeota bacterium]|nr:hypothetical protein [Candidatus Dormibacteraeota bacterium]
MVHDSSTTTDDEPADWGEFFEYLRSDKGHELATRIVSLFEEIKKATLDRSAEQALVQERFEPQHRRNSLIVQAGTLGLTIVAASVLIYRGKFDSTAGVLFGTLVGYVFGRRNA